MKHEQTYYEQVREEIEHLAECTTSDAQGIIGAWGQTKHSPGDAGQWAIDEAEQAGTTPEDLARQILWPQAGVRQDPRSGQYYPTVNGIDQPTTTFDRDLALKLAQVAVAASTR